jgi:hypothetical protein
MSGVELRALFMPDKHSTTELYLQPIWIMFEDLTIYKYIKHLLLWITTFQELYNIFILKSLTIIIQILQHS